MNESFHKIISINSFIAELFHKNLEPLSYDHPARLWLMRRGIGKEAIHIFKIGIAFDSLGILPRDLHQRDLCLRDAEAAAVMKSDGGRGCRSVFRNRIVFPIQNVGGDFIGFTARNNLLQPGPRYLGPIDTPVFSKKDRFYGLHQTKTAIESARQVIVVDGVLDMIALYMSGIKNVISLMGMYLYPEQAIEIEKLGVEVIMWLHSNEAGWSHLYRNLHMLRNRKVPARGVWLTRSYSSREFVQLAGPDRTLRWIENARTFEQLFSSSRPIEPVIIE